MITCPHCKNPIYDEEALLCHFCGESLGRASHGALGKLRYQSKTLIWVIIILVLFAFLAIILF